MPVMQPEKIKALLMHRIVGVVLAYLNCHTYILLEVVLTLLGSLEPGSDLLVCEWNIYSWGWLLLAITTITSNQRWPHTKIKGGCCLIQADLLTETSDCFRLQLCFKGVSCTHKLQSDICNQGQSKSQGTRVQICMRSVKGQGHYFQSTV